MACRNLTKQFMEVRAANKANKSLRAREDSSDDMDIELIESREDNTNWKAVKDTLPPTWVEGIEQIEEEILAIINKIRELEGFHKKRLMVNFETDESVQEREIDIKTQEITEVFRSAEGHLKKFSKQGEGATATEAAVRGNVQKSVAKRLQGLSMSFRSSQKEYLQRLNAQKSGNGSDAFKILNVPETKRPLQIEDEGFTQQQLAELDDTEILVDERDQEIVRIAKSIEELAQIFRELAALVIDQGTILDRIDYNMEVAVEHATEGKKQLDQAETHQKNALPCRCIIVLVILIAIMLGVLIWKHSDKTSTSSSSS